MNKDLDKLTSVKQAFTHWRATRLKQGKIPDYLWAQVHELLDDYSPAKICGALQINYAQIKENLTPKDDVDIQFVEVGEPPPVVTAPYRREQNDVCAVELHRPCGSMFKINALPVSMVSTLMLDFMG